MTEPATRTTFSSSWGTVLSTAGVAIGLGNIWRFPYMMGKHGGALFLVAYIAIAVAFGMPGLMAEWALARHTRRGTLGAFQRTGMAGGRWASYLLLLTVLMASSYYGVVVGWVLYFACHFGLDAIGIATSGRFDILADSFVIQGLCLLAVSLVAGAALYFGVHRGIERMSRIGLPLFFVLLIILLVRVLTMNGAWDGLIGLLKPQWADFTPMTPLATLGQVFFSFGLGGTFMLAYGSYMRDGEDIPRVAVLTAGADVAAALIACMIVIPAAVAFGLPAGSGPPLMFEVMPTVFHRMPGGGPFGFIFFGSVAVVALLSQMAAFEVVVGALIDGRGWPRGRAVVCVATLSTLLAIPALCSIRYIETSDLLWGSTMQPVGALFVMVAFAWYLDIGTALGEIRRGSRLPVPTWLYAWIRFGIPLGIAATLVYTLVTAIRA